MSGHFAFQRMACTVFSRHIPFAMTVGYDTYSSWKEPSSRRIRANRVLVTVSSFCGPGCAGLETNAKASAGCGHGVAYLPVHQACLRQHQKSCPFRCDGGPVGDARNCTHNILGFLRDSQGRERAKSEGGMCGGYRITLLPLRIVNQWLLFFAMDRWKNVYLTDL
jgi:hypothetical protein